MLRYSLLSIWWKNLHMHEEEKKGIIFFYTKIIQHKKKVLCTCESSSSGKRSCTGRTAGFLELWLDMIGLVPCCRLSMKTCLSDCLDMIGLVKSSNLELILDFLSLVFSTVVLTSSSNNRFGLEELFSYTSEFNRLGLVVSCLASNFVEDFFNAILDLWISQRESLFSSEIFC